MAKPCVRWPQCLHQRGYCGGTKAQKCMFYNLNKAATQIDAEKLNILKKQRRNIRQKAKRTFDKRPENIQMISS